MGRKAKPLIPGPKLSKLEDAQLSVIAQSPRRAYEEPIKRQELDRLQVCRKSDSYARWHKYGLSETAYQALIVQQGGVCAICREAKPLCVDHCHRTKRVRALLCFDCNLALGFLRESPLTARAAASYLEQQLVKELT